MRFTHILIFLTLLPFSCKKSDVPIVTTKDITGITDSQIKSGGVVLSSGGKTVTSRGVCWSTSLHPTILNSNTVDGQGTGAFISIVDGLSSSTKYYIRAYAANNNGIAYGDELEFTTSIRPDQLMDIDGNIYNSVTIGTQTWMKENLKVARYNDGNPIPKITDNNTWQTLQTPGFCWFNNDEAAYKNLYGALYNWYTVNTGKLCPDGWHVPSDQEFKTLEIYLGMTQAQADGMIYRGNNEASKLKSTTGWGPGDDGNNSSGFTALPGSCRSPNSENFVNASYGNWWTSTFSDVNNAYSRGIGYQNPLIARNLLSKSYGFSVRCLKDQ